MPLNPKTIKQLRERRRLTQQQAADASGMSRSRWAEIEAGMAQGSNPSLDRIEAIAKALGVGVARLLR
jgi:transcriptional regulator with XRE-family HTH domain